ncbi:MAG: hypothetical protein U0165_08310 [Polyangiaceae bacterium]
MKKSLFLVLAAVSSLVGLIAPGCSKDDPAPAANLGYKGESCEQRANCQSGLACVNKTCVAGTIGVKQTAKECVIIECSADADCCPPIDANMQQQCDQWQQNCTQFNDQSSCDLYNQYCGPARCNGYTCDTATSQCKYNQTCTDNTQCPSNICNNGQCAECADNSQCGDGNICNNGKCEVTCNLDSDCPEFNRCQNNVCVEGKCQTDRECKAATRNALATCDNGECVEPCQSDLECADPENWNFHACVKGKCVYVGCESDKECQYYYEQSGVPNNDGKDIVCRNKQ